MFSQEPQTLQQDLAARFPDAQFSALEVASGEEDNAVGHWMGWDVYIAQSFRNFIVFCVESFIKICHGTVFLV